MSVASEMVDRVRERGEANLEFAREGYRLSLNPIEDRLEEIGFILWREDGAGGLEPIATGRAADDRLLLDGDPTTRRETADLEAVIGSLLAAEPGATQAGLGNEGAIPTGT
jgi:hypothetical protein